MGRASLFQKKCTACEQTLPIECFYFLKRRAGEYSARCIPCGRMQGRVLRRTRRIALLSQYSPGGILQCAHCSESRVDVLDLDHIHGGGIQERKQHKSPLAYYKWLKDSGYPPGLRVLCRNCNWLAWIERKDRDMMTVVDRRSQLFPEELLKIEKGAYHRSESHRRKLSLAGLGKKLSEETKQKMSASRIGKKQSEETIQKRRDTMARKKLERESEKEARRLTAGRLGSS